MAYARLALVAVALLLPLAALVLVAERAQQQRAPFDGTMPDELGGWKAARDHRLDEEAAEMLAPEAYSMRLYAAEDQPPIWIYAAFYRGIGSIGAHDPLICYPAQGWTITERREVPLELGPAKSFPAWFMRTELSGTEELVLYWFQPARRWPASELHEPVARAFDRLAGHTEYAFIRLSLRRPPSRRPVSEVDLAPLVGMATELAPWARQAVDAGSGS